MAMIVLVLLGGCALAVPDPRPVSPRAERWQAELPHAGDVAGAVDWWRRVGDPILMDLVAAAQADNPGLEGALARIEQSRAAARVAGASLLPRLDAGSNLVRSKSPMPPVPVVLTSRSATLDALWELDLFGASRRGREAAVARAEAARHQWHDARISLAAEVGQAYLDLRACEALLQVYREDQASLLKSRDLTRRKVDAGFGAPADLELVNASAADGSGRVKGQDAQCRIDRVTLGWLTGLDAEALERRLATGVGQLPEPAAVGVDGVPARVLDRRPDLAALQKEIEATSLEVGVAKAHRFPTLKLTGSIGYSHATAFGQTFKGPQWSIGPGLVAPLFDAGRSAAQVAQADARFAEAMTNWQQRARLAVREVETALLRIASAQGRLEDADQAVVAWQRYQRAAESRYENGTGSLFEQEEARRSSLQANANRVRLIAERFAGWLSLYKAVGGDWQDQDQAAAPDPALAVAGVPLSAASLSAAPVPISVNRR